MQSALNDWSASQDDTSGKSTSSQGFKSQQSGLTEGIGSLDDSTKLMPEIKESLAQFFGLLKGPIMMALLVLTGAQMAVGLLGILARMVLSIAGIEGFLSSAATGLETLVGSVLSVVVAVFHVALFRPANDQVTGFTQGPPASFKDALKVSSPAFVPVLLACLMCGGVMGFGTLFCFVPGVIAFIALFPMRYLSATRPDFTEYKFMQVLESSLMVGKKYWAAVLAMGLAIGLILGVSAGVTTATSAVSGIIAVMITESMGAGAAGAVISSGIFAVARVVVWVVSALALMATWVIEGGVMSVLARHEDLVRQSEGHSIGEGA